MKSIVDLQPICRLALTVVEAGLRLKIGNRQLPIGNDLWLRKLQVT